MEGTKVGVIQNELGKISIDGTVLQNNDIQMVELNRGSIFCSCLRLSFVDALVQMSRKGLEYVFVESSGFGDPSNAEEILAATEVMAPDAYDFKGCICLVDCYNFLDQIGDSETIDRQLKHCNLAVLTKVDLVDSEQIEQVKDKVREINPVCPITESANGNIDRSFYDMDLMLYKWAECEDTTNSSFVRRIIPFLSDYINFFPSFFFHFKESLYTENIRFNLCKESFQLFLLDLSCKIHGKCFWFIFR